MDGIAHVAVDKPEVRSTFYRLLFLLLTEARVKREWMQVFRRLGSNLALNWPEKCESAYVNRV